MLGDVNPFKNKENATDIFQTGVELIRNQSYADALLLFYDLAADNTQIAAGFNLALCYVHSGELTMAMSVLEKANSALKKQPMAQKPPMNARTAYENLIQKSLGVPEYMFPMPQKLPELLPESARRNILRLLVDVCAASQAWDKVTNYAAIIPEKNYENVKKAIQDAQRTKGFS